MTGGTLLTVAVVAGSGCLLFTDPINMPPTVKLVMDPAQIWHGQPAAFQANVSDPNGDTVTLDWAYVSGPCSDDAVPGPALRARGQSNYAVPGSETAMPFCVWVFATDSHGATAAPAHSQVDPLDHAPVAAISVVRPNPVPPVFPLYSTLEFSGAGSTDADATDLPNLMYHFGLVGQPPGSQASVVPCLIDTDPKFTCLTPDKPGDYQVQLVVNDGQAQMNSVTKTVTVAPDALPCLGSTMPVISASPIVRLSNDPDVMFSVTVVDDVDPFPAGPLGVAHFSWFLGHGTDPVEYLGRDFASYSVPAGAFVIGDNARVRVEIRDDQNQDKIAAALLSCGDEPRCAAVPGSGCLQRMTWTVEYR
jgi:hypothetical protein